MDEYCGFSISFRMPNNKAFHHNFRGASVGQEQSKQLNKLGGNILRKAGYDFEKWMDYDWLRKTGYLGYAHFYIRQYKCYPHLHWIEKSVHSQLLEIDSELGTSISEQPPFPPPFPPPFLPPFPQMTSTRSGIIQSSYYKLNEYKSLKKHGFAGFAHFYLKRCYSESEAGDTMDVQVYDRLISWDSKFGTTAAEQLLKCLSYSLNSDLIKVSLDEFSNYHF